MEEKNEKEIIDKHVRALSEHFDCVQILVSKFDEEGNTSYIPRGSGNWYARKAMCEEFIEQNKASNIAIAIKEKNEEND